VQQQVVIDRVTALGDVEIGPDELNLAVIQLAVGTSGESRTR